MDSPDYTKDEAAKVVEYLNIECHSGDIEVDHSKADERLCEFLRYLGHPEASKSGTHEP